MTRLAAPAVGAIALLGALAVPTLGHAQKFSPTGVYNCPVSKLYLCEDGKCSAKDPEEPMEMSIDFDNKTACVRRKGRCRTSRSFVVSERGNSQVLTFPKEGMAFRIRAGGKLIGADLSARGLVGVSATCARG